MRSNASSSRRRGSASRPSSTRRRCTGCSPAMRRRSSSRSAQRPRSICPGRSRSPTRSGGGCRRSARTSPLRRSSTSPATRAGAASRRRTARTRTSPRCSAAPTSAGSRARTSSTASPRPPSTSSGTAWPRAGSTRRPRTSGRVSCATADLLARMTLDEKLAQLGSLWSFELFRSETELDPALIRDRLADGIGHISRVAGATNLGPIAAAEAGNAIQRFLVEETRLGIPAFLHEETLHGLLAREATSFQQSIGAAASFDPVLVEAVADIDPAADAGDRGERGPCTGLRHHPGPALGPRRGDVRRGPVPRRGARLRLRPRAPGRRTSNTASPRPPSTSSGTAWPRAGSTRHPRTSGRVSCATSSCCRSRRPFARPASPASCPRTATSTAFPVMRRTSS